MRTAVFSPGARGLLARWCRASCRLRRIDLVREPLLSGVLKVQLGSDHPESVEAKPCGPSAPAAEITASIAARHGTSSNALAESVRRAVSLKCELARGFRD